MFSCWFKLIAFCLVRFVRVMFALLFFSEIRIALDTPPAPMTRAFLFSRFMFSSFREFWKPVASVLWPMAFGVSVFGVSWCRIYLMVFTA